MTLNYLEIGTLLYGTRGIGKKKSEKNLNGLKRSWMSCRGHPNKISHPFIVFEIFYKLCKCRH